MDLSLNIAVGSSLQIALFVTPMLVFASYAFSRPMDLEFSLPEIVESNWLEGVQLLSVYVIMAILFFFLPETVHPNPTDSPTQGPAASQTTP